MEIFNRTLLMPHMLRAQKIRQDGYDFLFAHMARALQDRLLDIKRGFDIGVEIGSGVSVLDDVFRAQKDFAQVVHVSPFAENAHTDVVLDEEFWPFATHSLDAIVSAGNLHWVNDLPGVLVQMRQSLKPDGLFLSGFFGGETLQELRACIAQAESEIYDGMSPRVSPFVSLPDMAALMQRAQFALPVVDHELLTITYGSLQAMVNDLRAMGQTHAVHKRDRRVLTKNFWPRVEEIYKQNFANDKGRMVTTVEIIYALGWAPAASQPQPLKRGTATHKLEDFLNRQ